MTLHRTVTLFTDAQGRPSARGLPWVEYKVLSGPDRSLKVQHSSERLRVGTSEACEVRLTDGTVSALHCEFVFDASGLRVRDLSSKNGVVVSGVRVGDAVVESGATITLGRTTLEVTVLDQHAENPLVADQSLEGLIGSSLAMRVLYGQIRRASESAASVLIQGAIGTGKELAAEALVALSDRAKRPVVVLDCHAIPEELAETELFGHEEGAFTGASKLRQGVFERADTGTVILDEVGELSATTQARLLGVLQRKRFTRVGGTVERSVDVRVIALTAHDLPRLVNQELFRADLYYRLAGLELRVPTVSERREDIPLLIAHRLKQLGSGPVLDVPTLRHLCSREYAGNVRELFNAVERSLASLEAPLPEAASSGEIDLSVPYAKQRQQRIDGFERAYVEKLLKANGGNVSASARMGGMNRVHLHQLITRLGLNGAV